MYLCCGCGPRGQLNAHFITSSTCYVVVEIAAYVNDDATVNGAAVNDVELILSACKSLNATPYYARLSGASLHFMPFKALPHHGHSITACDTLCFLLSPNERTIIISIKVN